MSQPGIKRLLEYCIWLREPEICIAKSTVRETGMQLTANQAYVYIIYTQIIALEFSDIW